MVMVLEMRMHFCKTSGRFTKLDLSRGWEVDPVRALRGICWMYCLDVSYKMFPEMMKEYYKTFWWEKITSPKMKVRYGQIVNELNMIVADQKNQIASLSRQISFYEVQSVEGNRHNIDKVVPQMIVIFGRN